MSITFKQFVQVTQLDDEQFSAIEEGLSDIPGFGWLKGADNKAKLDRIRAERDKLKNRRDKLATDRSAELDAWLTKATEKMPKLQQQQDTGDDPFSRDPDTRKFSAKMDRMQSMSRK